MISDEVSAEHDIMAGQKMIEGLTRQRLEWISRVLGEKTTPAGALIRCPGSTWKGAVDGRVSRKRSDSEDSPSAVKSR